MSKNEELKVAKELHEATVKAREAVKEAAETHRRLLHSKHMEKTFRMALDSLDLQLTGDRERLIRRLKLGRSK